MHMLDSDNGLLRDSDGRQAVRDIVQVRTRGEQPDSVQTHQPHVRSPPRPSRQTMGSEDHPGELEPLEDLLLFKGSTTDKQY